MEDVQKSPDTNEATVVTVTEAPSIAVVDGWIDSLMTCKQLSEADVQRLCEKVHKASLELARRVLDMLQVKTNTFQQAREILQEESNVQPVVS